jgi:hypothetical protein
MNTLERIKIAEWHRDEASRARHEATRWLSSPSEHTRLLIIADTHDKSAISIERGEFEHREKQNNEKKILPSCVWHFCESPCGDNEAHANASDLCIPLDTYPQASTIGKDPWGRPLSFHPYRWNEHKTDGKVQFWFTAAIAPSSKKIVTLRIFNS